MSLVSLAASNLSGVSYALGRCVITWQLRDSEAAAEAPGHSLRGAVSRRCPCASLATSLPATPNRALSSSAQAEQSPSPNMTAHIDLTWLTGSGAGSAWDDLPLTDLISKAATLHSNADAIRTGPDAEQRQGAAIVLCRTLASRVERAGLFSANEEGDDLATADLKYLLAPYYLAELTGSSAPAGGPSARLQAVQEAVQNYSVFLQQCRQYELLGSVASSQYSQEENNVSGQCSAYAARQRGSSYTASQPQRAFSHRSTQPVTARLYTATQGGQTDATTRRNAKIERFKAGKQIKSQIAMLERQKEHSKGDDEVCT